MLEELSRCAKVIFNETGKFQQDLKLYLGFLWGKEMGKAFYIGDAIMRR